LFFILFNEYDVTKFSSKETKEFFQKRDTLEKMLSDCSRDEKDSVFVQEPWVRKKNVTHF